MFHLGGFRLLDDRRGLHDVDAALEISAVVDDDTRGLDVADQAAVPLNRDFLGDFHISLHIPRDHDLARPDLRLHLAARADRQAVLQLELALHFTVDVQLLTAEDVALDDHGTSDGRGRARGCLLRHFAYALRRRWRRWLSDGLRLRIPVEGCRRWNFVAFIPHGVSCRL